jgi:hypothetical protein
MLVKNRALACQPAVVPKIAAAACYPIVMIELIFILAAYLSALLLLSKASIKSERAHRGRPSVSAAPARRESLPIPC